MNVLGINVGWARPKETTPEGRRHPLSDGSAALLADRHLVFAAIEERHSRRRYSGGFSSVVGAFSRCELWSDLNKIDVVASSSCCGPKWSSDPDVIEEIQEDLPPGIWNGGNHVQLVVVDHHDSHASLGFALSGSDSALVAVIDGFGNLADDSERRPHKWWRDAFHRHSYYLAERKNGGFGLTRVAADALGPDDVGIGEAYRALTHFCGWHSYQQAGAAMALAAFGDTRFHSVPFIKLVGGRIRCCLSNDHDRLGETIAEVLRRHGHAVSSLRHHTATPEDQDHCSVVRAVQDQLTEALCARLLQLAKCHHANTIVVTGGVALNCLAMGELQRRFEGRVFVPPAPSDTGQGLGNAIWASFCLASPCFTSDVGELDIPEAPFWGIPCNNVNLAARDAARNGQIVLENQTEAAQFEMAAQALAEGRVVAIAMGRSEHGPRALGRRSVLADPRNPQALLLVNRFKRREPHRPFAPAVLQECADDYIEWHVDSPYMSFAVKVRPEAKRCIPAVVHADGTARVQTVPRDSHSPLRPILEQFHRLTGVPLLLNTSFNRKGEPMVETPKDAVHAFLNPQLDLLLLDGVTIRRKGAE